MLSNTTAYENIRKYALMTENQIYQAFKSSDKESNNNNTKKNKIHKIKHNHIILHSLKKSFINPFSVVLLLLACISLLTDVILKPQFSRNFTSFIIISSMLFLSGTVRFIQERKSRKISDELTKLVDTKVKIRRSGKWSEINIEEANTGDIILLKAGDRVPADIRLLKSDNCCVSQSVITGESKTCLKTSKKLDIIPDRISDYSNIIFYGTTIITGMCIGLIVSTAENAVYNNASLDTYKKKDGFDRGANSIACVLIKFMVILVPIVFVSCGLTKDNWVSALIFSVSAAVGLTPELLPMVITACLAKGSYNMGQKQTIVKNINAMQGFGSMDVLCMDKTGTLTNDALTLEYFMDVLGNESQQVLDCALITSYYHSGIIDHIDSSILNARLMPGKEEHFSEILKRFAKLDELSFDYKRKISSVLVSDNHDSYIISKGSVQDILERCKYVYHNGSAIEIGNDPLNNAKAIVSDLLEDGVKVIALSAKKTGISRLSYNDEAEMVLLGYIGFFDAPKTSAKSAINKLKGLNLNIKVLTGDNLEVAVSICKRLGMNYKDCMTGRDFDLLNDNDAQVAIEKCDIFAELSPGQKAQIVSLLESNGHTVGFLGDGINDLQAISQADVGISIDTAVKAVKDTADVILLKKDLNVLEEGILEGRRSFVNMSKYIKITASSNLGNIISIVAAGIFLPFFPMTSIQILLLNLLYDIMCLILPWDNVDDELIKKPMDWSGNTLDKFMIWFGPLSSIFDITTFIFLILFLCPQMCGNSFFLLSYQEQLHYISIFQTGWFLESMWTQVLILQLLRTKKLPIVESRASLPVMTVTLTGIVLLTIIAMTPLGSSVGLTILPPVYFLFLIFTVLCYLLVVTVAKQCYIKKYDKLI